MPKYYFQKNDDNAYSMQYHLKYMKENNIEQMEVFEAIVERRLGYFFCKKLQEISEINNTTCGIRWCEYYKPRNGKSGICKNYGYCYDHGKSKIIYQKNR